jgi:putative NADPH-quinone reductase
VSRSVLLIQGHPDPGQGHFCDALAAAYRDGAVAAGHSVEELAVAELNFPWLRNAEEFEKQPPPADIAASQAAIDAADLLVFVYPLWLGDMPAILKAFLEQTFRPGFVTESGQGMDTLGARRLKGKSARIIVSMGMPAPFYRLFYRAHSVKSFRRNILKFCGLSPVRITLIGGNGGNTVQRERWMQRLKSLGASG